MEKKEIIYGRNPVFEYLKTSDTDSAAELYVNENAHGKIIDKIVAEAKRKGIKPIYKEKKFFSKMGRSSEHQGVALKSPQKISIKNKIDLLKQTAEKKGVLLLLDQLTDPHNVGSIIRTTEALGGDGIIITKSNSPGITPTVIKSSAGATAHIDILIESNISGLLETAKRYGFWIVGTSDHGNSELSELGGIRPVLIIIGSEGKGMRQLVESKCDFIVKIPLQGKVNSLNASVAAGIVIYEIMKLK